jgi:hypothetical protein
MTEAEIRQAMLDLIPRHQRCAHCGAKPASVADSCLDTPCERRRNSSGMFSGYTRRGVPAQLDYSFYCARGHKTRVHCEWRQE